MDSMQSGLKEIQQQIDAAARAVDTLMKGYRSPDKANALLDMAMQQMENSCIAMRRICEQVRPMAPPRKGKNYYTKSLFGEITLMDTGWVHIKLNTLLPHYKVLGGTQYVTDCITRLLDKLAQEGGQLPVFSRAYVAIVDHCEVSRCDVFDDDNKGFRAVLNALKGRLFPDDNQFELSLGLFTELDTEACCHIYILPEQDVTDFHSFRLAEGGPPAC